MFDTTGLTEVKMRKYAGRQGSYFLSDDECVAKTCSVCRNILPVGKFGRSAGNRYGLSARCRGCDRADAFARSHDPVKGFAARHERNRSRTGDQILLASLTQHPDGTKECMQCRERLDLSHFSKDRNFGDGLSKRCGPCHSSTVMARKRKEFLAHWKKHAIPLVCYVCEDPWGHADHVVPRALGGSDEPQNILPLCAKHNFSKNDTPLLKWLTQNYPEQSEEIMQRVFDYNVDPFTKHDIVWRLSDD